MLELFSYSLSLYEIAILIIAAMFIGMGKTGTPGTGMVAVPLIVIIFGSKESTGVVLPLLVFADLFAVYYYSQYANWQHLRKLLPLTLIGIVLASIVGAYINDVVFRNIMGITIFIVLGLMIWRERNPNPSTPTSLWFVITIGIIGGFVSMIGNLAGPIVGLYLLAMRFPKKEFIGTAAWYFLTINLFKVPFHIFAWETITLNSFLLNLALLPSIALGALIGIKTVKLINETVFRYLVMSITFIAAVVIFL